MTSPAKRLESILAVRERREQAATAALAAARHAEEQCRRALQQTRDTFARASADLEERKRQGMLVQDMMLLEYDLSVLLDRLRDAGLALHRAAEATEEAAREAAATRRQREALEQLHQQRQQSESARREAAAARELDDLGGRRPPHGDLT